MKLGIDISQIVYEGTGVARFTSGLLNAILDFDVKNEWTFFFSSLRRKLDPEIENKIVKKGFKLIKWKLPPTLLSLLFNDLHSLSKYLISNIRYLNDFDWFITSDWVEIPLNVNKATIVHDLVFLRYPQTVDKKIINTQKKRFEWVRSESKLIIADSNATKKDLLELMNFDSNKIRVNYPGVEVKKPAIDQVNSTLKKYNLNKPFILTVGKIEPRKNIARLIDAMKQLNDESIDLVLVGPKGWDSQNVKSQISNVKYLGLISDLELFSLYSSCLFFVYPSIWEGFGYPLVEAMKLAAPVTASDTSSLREIAGDSALLFDPLKVEDIYHCLDSLMHNKNLRTELIKKGKKRSRIYTWKNYLNNMLQFLATDL